MAVRVDAARRRGRDARRVILREYSTVEKTVVTEAYLPMEDLAATEAFLATVIEQFA